MRAVASQGKTLGVLNHAWVAIEPDSAKVVTGCEQLVSVLVREGRGAIAMVDVGAIHALLPDALGGPLEDAGVGGPFKVCGQLVYVRSLGFLRGEYCGFRSAVFDLEVQQLSRPIIGSDPLGISRPVEVVDEGCAGSDDGEFAIVFGFIDVNSVVMAAHSEVAAIGGVLEVLYPFFAAVVQLFDEL
jgi:hypothetical protein